MKEDSIEDLKKKIAQLEKASEYLIRQRDENWRVIQLLIAAELVSKEKVDQAVDFARI